MFYEAKSLMKDFKATLAGERTYEIRPYDLPYALGDIMRLREWSSLQAVKEANDLAGYTGRTLDVVITHITYPLDHGLPDRLCVMSIRPVPPDTERPLRVA